MRLEVTDIRTLTDEQPQVREFEFRRVPVTLGSHSDNLVQLPDLNIAGHHATLQPAGEHWTYQPVLRDGQTRINGESTNESTELNDGDVIELSFFSIKVIFDEELLAALEPAKPEDISKIRQFPLPPRSVTRKHDEEIKLNAGRQGSIANLSAKLGACHSIAQLLETVTRTMLTELTGRLAWMGVRRGNMGPVELMDGRNDAGEYVGEPPNYATYEYRCLARHQFITVPRTGDAETQSVLAVPIMAERGAIGLIYVDSRKHTRVYDDGDLDFATMASGIMAPVLDRLLSKGDGDLGSSGVTDVRVIQEAKAVVLPAGLPQWPQLQLAAYTKLGREGMGDVHDAMRMPNGLAFLVVAHVTAPALRIPAAVGQVHGAFQLAGMHADPPAVYFKALNHILFNERAPCTMDAVAVVTNAKTGVAEVAVAGRTGAFLIDAQGRPRRIAAEAPAVGISRSAEYTGITFRIPDGATLALFTPGCFQATDAAGNALGEDRLLEVLCDGFGLPAQAALDELLLELAPFFSGDEAKADITLLLATRMGGAGEN